AGAVGPQKSHDFPLVDAKGHIANRERRAAIALGEAFDRDHRLGVPNSMKHRSAVAALVGRAGWLRAQTSAETRAGVVGKAGAAGVEASAGLEGIGGEEAGSPGERTEEAGRAEPIEDAARVADANTDARAVSDMIFVPAGPFTMGADKGGQEDEHPAHQVTLA